MIIALITAFGAMMSAGLNLVLFDEMMKTVPGRHIVTFSGVDNALFNLSSITAPVLGAVLGTVLGIGPALLVAAGVTLVGAILFVLAGPTPNDQAATVTQAEAVLSTASTPTESAST